MKTTPLALLLGLALAACDENPSTPPLGSLSLTTAAPTVQQGFTTADGWNVKYTQFLVNVSAVTIAGADGVVTASSEAQIFDLVPPEPQVLVSSDNRVARAWEDVSLGVGPATEESALTGAVTEADRVNMVAGTFSVFVQATLTRGPVTKTLRAGFTPNMAYQACRGPLNGVDTPGLVVPKNGADTAAVGFTGDVLFFDNPVTFGHVVRGDAIAAADLDNDGVVVSNELSSLTLEELRNETVRNYEAPEGVENLYGFLNEQARSIVATFRDTGGCTPSVVTEAP